MKLKNLIQILFVSLLLINLVSACNTYHPNRYSDELNTNDNVILVIKYPDSYSPDESWNEERYPVNDYRNGYSYRTSSDYARVRYQTEQRNNHIERINTNVKPNNYYVYNEYMRSYEEHQCYTQAPSDKLFYIKCK
jgi:hypothetical protein